MEQLKGLILSGGKGTRLQPITFTSAKQLVPVANRPVLFYGIDAMARAGIKEIGIIIAPETGDEIRETVGDGSQFGVKVSFIEQDQPAGLAHAVLTAEPFLGEDPFVMYLGDNLLQGGISDLVEAFRASSPDALILLTPVTDPENYGVAELDGDRVVSLQEKPPQPKTDLALVGVYMFTAGIHDAARAIEPSARGELEITDAIQYLVDQGKRVEPHIVEGWWKVIVLWRKIAVSIFASRPESSCPPAEAVIPSASERWSGDSSGLGRPQVICCSARRSGSA